MQFSCDNCQAKYQIADERAAGRTLKMTCKHCGHVIYIRGAEVSASASPEPEAAPALPALRSSAPVWHVGIDDVPHGPLPLEEIAKRIAAGEVNAESPCWREGLDDWAPLGEIPELAKLLSGEPPPAPAEDEESAEAAPLTLSEDAVQRADDSDEREAAPPEAARAEEWRPAVAPAATSAPPAPRLVEPDAPPLAPPRKERGASRVLTSALVGLLCGAGGYFLGLSQRAPAEEPEEAARRDTPADEVDEPAPYEPAARFAEPAPAPAAAAPSEPESAAPKAARRAPARPSSATSGVTQAKSTAKTASKKPADRPLTAEERRLLESYGGGGSTSPSVGGASARTGSSRATAPSSAPTLDAAALQRVVTKNKASLQQCHERATRGMPMVEAQRITVSVTVGSSGIVTRAIAVGASLTDLNACVEAAVKRWQFPSGGEARFPVVFPAS